MSDLEPKRRDGRKKTEQNKTKILNSKLPVFLDLLRQAPYVKLAAERLHIPLGTLYMRRKVDKKFREAWDDAIAEAVHASEGELWRRGVQGVNRFVVSAGRVVMIKKGGKEVPLQELQYSDQCLITLMKAHDPKYRDNKVISHVGKGGGPIQTAHIDVNALILQKEQELVKLGGDPVQVKRDLIRSLSSQTAGIGDRATPEDQ